MNDVTKVQKDAITDFAKFADHVWQELKPWASTEAEEYTPTIQAFGGVANSTADLTYEYEPLTIAEFEAERQTTLSPALDPGPGVVNSMGSGISDIGSFASEWGWAMNPVTAVPGAIDKLGGDDHSGQIADWYDYYAARGPSEAVFVEGSTGPEDAPWAEPLHTGWSEAVDNRLLEVDEVRNEIDVLLPILAAAAEEYADVDLASSIRLYKYDLSTLDTDDLPTIGDQQ